MDSWKQATQGALGCLLALVGGGAGFVLALGLAANAPNAAPDEPPDIGAAVFGALLGSLATLFLVPLLMRLAALSRTPWFLARNVFRGLMERNPAARREALAVALTKVQLSLDQRSRILALGETRPGLALAVVEGRTTLDLAEAGLPSRSS